MTTEASESSPPYFTFAIHPSLIDFTDSAKTYLSAHPNEGYMHLATGALVFSPSSLTSQTPARILLLQRASTDTSPNLWEPPGGACDDDDLSILHGVARELFEESGLVATSIEKVVSGVHRFESRSGKKVGKFCFMVEVGVGEVKLDPKEHQDFVWASEEEVIKGETGRVKLVFTSDRMRETVLEGFRLLKA